MKLFFWRDVDALQQYGPGLAFAHADTKKRAIQLVMRSLGGRLSAYSGSRIWKELTETEPEIYEGEFGRGEKGSA